MQYLLQTIANYLAVPSSITTRTVSLSSGIITALSSQGSAMPGRTRLKIQNTAAGSLWLSTSSSFAPGNGWFMGTGASRDQFEIPCGPSVVVFVYTSTDGGAIQILEFS